MAEPLPPAAQPRRLPIGKGLVALAAVAVAAAATVWLIRDERAMATAPAPPQPVPVQVVTAKREDVPVYLTGLGTVQAFNTVTVQSRVDGEIQQVLFTEGQMVKTGDLLAVIDPRPFQAALDEATAKIVQDQANLLILEGAMPWDVDRVLREFGFRMGPFAMSDLSGLDIGWNAAKSKGETLRDVLCEMDRRGQKTGAGYYDYDA